MPKQEAQNVIYYYGQGKEILLKELESRSSDSIYSTEDLQYHYLHC